MAEPIDNLLQQRLQGYADAFMLRMRETEFKRSEMKRRNEWPGPYAAEMDELNNARTSSLMCGALGGIGTHFILPKRWGLFRAAVTGIAVMWPACWCVCALCYASLHCAGFQFLFDWIVLFHIQVIIYL